MNSKKVISLLAALMLSVSMLAGCSDDDDKLSSRTTTKTTTTEAQAEETTEEATEAETTEEATEESTKAPSGGDEVSAVEASTSSKEAPITLGKWAKIATYAVEDEIYHNVNVRITKVTTTSEDKGYVDDAIALNNKLSSDYGQINVADLKLPSDCELCIIDYEVNIPADFPVGELGTISAPNFSFSVSNINGGGIPNADGTATYIGLSSVRSLKTEEDPKYKPGNTYSFKSYFAMVKGFEDFVVTTHAYPEGTEDLSAAESYDAYFASR